MALEKAIDLLLSGTVTGVGFRVWVRGLAQRTGVTGWIRNNTDRTVSAHIEGEAQVVEGFLEQLRRPNLEGATVDDIQVRDSERHGYSDFSIEYN